MNTLTIPKGCVFGSANPMWIGRAINVIQWVWSRDSDACYSHAGLFIDDRGTTLECLMTVKSQNFFEAYKGEKVIIAQPKASVNAINLAVESIRIHEGQFYPFWRLLFHMIPPLAKIGVLERLVCSELVAKYEWLLGLRHRQYKGTNPDTLVDEWIRWKAFDVIFEGVLPQETGEDKL